MCAGTAYRESRQGRDTLQRGWLKYGNRVQIILACRHSGYSYIEFHVSMCYRVAAKHCACCPLWLQSFAAYCCRHSFCTCNTQFGSPHNPVDCLVAEPEGKATNLDTQVTEHLYICILFMSVTVSYGHLARGLKFVSVAIPMASSCSIYLLTFGVLDSGCFQFFAVLVAVNSANNLGS